MAALDLLNRLCLDCVELRVRGGDLAFTAPKGALDAAAVADLRQHKAELLTLLNGSTCRHCRGPIVWRPSEGHVSLADGTSLHFACRSEFEVQRIALGAERAVAPALQTDPAEITLCGQLDLIEQEAGR